jgi:hypothetical protein
LVEDTLIVMIAIRIPVSSVLDCSRQSLTLSCRDIHSS